MLPLGFLIVGAPFPVKAIRRGMAALQLYNRDAISLSDAEPITCFIILERTKMAPLFVSLSS